MAKVIIWRDGAVESEFDPGHRDWRIGRSETNDIALLDPRKSVSRFHAELREENGRWVFIDLNSQNGSWKDGQRVNRLVLEHGHEILFGDYKLAFEDVKVAAPPPPVPAAAGVETAAVAATADVPIAPDQTLLMPGSRGAAVPAAPAGPPPPVVRPAVKAKAPRKGVNPVILLLFIVTMLGAVAIVAWRLMTDSPSSAPVAENSIESPSTPEPTPAPSSTPSPTNGTPADAAPSASTAPATTTPAPAAPATVTPPAPAPPSAPASAPATPPVAGPQTGPGAGPSTATPRVPATSPGGASPAAPGPAARPKRTPASQPRESPAVATRYEEGRRALASGRYTEAQRAFEAVLAQQPNYRDAAARLEEAKQGHAAAGEKALSEAQALEAGGDWAKAVAAYERAGAPDRTAAARAKMTAAGDDAYRKARQFDARNRPSEAITWYQRAVAWLPDADARKATAQERLAALKGGDQ